MPRFHTYYDNLKVSRTASTDLIRAAYRRLSQKHHPDRNPGNPDAARVMVLLNIAYRALSDPDKRAAHDRWIAQQEARAEPHRTPAGSYPPPPPPRPSRPSRSRKPPLDRSDMPESLRQLARGAVFYVLTMLIFSPLLMTVATWWKTPESRPAPSQHIIHTPQPKPTSPSIVSAPHRLPEMPDLSGVYRLVKSDFRFEDGEPVVHSKGKLEIRRMRANTYLLLEAKTIQSVGTSGRAYVYHIRPGRYAFDKLQLHRNSRNWAVLEGDQLVKHEPGTNYRETTWWRQVPEGYSEKYLDRGIKEAEWGYKVRVERGVADQ
ncbi:MAG: J domain-containing protein [Sulfuricellaceae bacterium]|nr:J domain-containing protein [Sulfuricellaceae bacterium]